MTDVEKEIDELQGKLSAKTREIEALLAEELNLGNIHAMEAPPMLGCEPTSRN